MLFFEHSYAGIFVRKKIKASMEEAHLCVETKPVPFFCMFKIPICIFRHACLFFSAYVCTICWNIFSNERIMSMFDWDYTIIHKIEIARSKHAGYGIT